MSILTLVKKIYAKTIDETVFFFSCAKICGVNPKEIKKTYKWRTKFESRGNDYPDKTFYVIRKYTPNAGVFSYMNTCVTNLRFCKEKGYTPVVDLQNNESIYLCKDNIGELNVWDFFFQQPSGFSLDNIKCSKNVIINDGGYRYGSWAFDIFKNQTDKDFEEYRKITHRYIRFSDAVIKRYDSIYDKFFTATDIICGVLCRGGGYTKAKPANHPVQPSLEEITCEIDYVLSKYNCNKIYLATEDNESFNYLKGVYGEILFCIKDFSDGRFINSNPTFSSQQQKIEKGINYAASVYMLSKCDCLVAGNTSGSIAARLLSDGYKYEKVFDLGRY